MRSETERLLMDLETLLNEEYHAIQQGNWDYADTILSKKGALLQRLNAIHPDSQDSLKHLPEDKKARFLNLKKKQQLNQSLLESRMAETDEQLEELKKAQEKQKNLAKVYGTTSPGKEMTLLA